MKDKKNNKELEHSSSFTMKQLPDQEKPYEKCLAYGPDVLSDAELLAAILRTGSQGQSVVDMCRSLLNSLNGEGLCGLYNMTSSELMQMRGIGKVKAVQIECLLELTRRISRARISDPTREGFNDPNKIADYYMEDFRHESQEKLLVVMLGSKGRLLGDCVVSVGTVDRTLASPRDIFVAALSRRAAGIVLLHNHPSGDPQPSDADIRLTERVRKCGEMMGVPLLDHIIIGDKRSVSFAREHLL